MRSSTLRTRRTAIVLAAVVVSLAAPPAFAAASEALPGDAPGLPFWPYESEVLVGTSETFADVKADGSYYDPSLGRWVEVAGDDRAAAGRVDASAELTRVARVYSLGVGTVHCATAAAWDVTFASAMGWAYTNLRDEHAVLGPTACEGALNVGNATVALWQQALGALALTHEAFHLRRWRFRRDEGKVSCQALVYFRDAAQRLGATVEQAELLYPYAFALHTHQTRLFPLYRDAACVIPPWAPPSR